MDEPFNSSYARRLPLLAQTNGPLVLSRDASNETSTARDEQPYAIRTLIREVSNAVVNVTLVPRSSSNRLRQ